MEVIPREQGDKPTLRLKFKNERAEFDALSGASVQPLIEAHIKRLIGDLNEPGIQVCLYRPMKGEARFAITPEREFYYPRLEGEELKFLRPRGPFKKSKLGIEEPDPSKADALDLSRPILVFCPAVAVDAQGGRLGMGKGYYDRFFARNPDAHRAAVVYQIQFSTVPLHADSWDQPVDWIVSEKMILRSLRRSN